jgi:hypothetical protein
MWGLRGSPWIGCGYFLNIIGVEIGLTSFCRGLADAEPQLFFLKNLPSPYVQNDLIVHAHENPDDQQRRSATDTRDFVS